MFDRETAYFFQTIVSAVKGGAPQAPPESLDWHRVLMLSQKQEVYSVFAACLPAEYLPEKEAKILLNYAKSELTHRIAMNHEQMLLEQALCEKGIDFMPLKGSLLKALYPKESMRQMSDVDILYDVDKREALLSLMKARGYTLYSWSENSDDFHKEPYYTFEFHRELFFDEFGFCPDFGFVWENATADEKNPYKKHMRMEDVYLHCVAHMYKHKVLGGFGIRFLCDLYLLLTHASTLDMVYIQQKLDAMGLTAFETFARDLTMALFEERPLTSEQENFLKQLLQFGLFGDATVGVQIKFEQFEKKYHTNSLARYVLVRLFPDRDYMRRTYPVLNKFPWLLGYYYAQRLVTKTFTDSSKAVIEIQRVRKIKKKEQGTEHCQ